MTFRAPRRSFAAVFLAGVLSGAALLSPRAAAAATPAPQRAALASNKEKASYIIGMNIGKSLHNDGVEVDYGPFMQGMKDALANAQPQLTQAEIREKDLQSGQDARAKVSGEKNKKEGESYLAKNKSQQGVKTTASGLQYKLLKEGTGKIPTTADTVTAHYRGTLLDGTEFDSSYKRGEPAHFPVTGVIAGWTEVLQLMKVGSKVQVAIPANLAYGERGAGQQIGPNAALLFEIELLDAKQE